MPRRNRDLTSETFVSSQSRIWQAITRRSEIHGAWQFQSRNEIDRARNTLTMSNPFPANEKHVSYFVRIASAGIVCAWTLFAACDPSFAKRSLSNAWTGRWQIDYSRSQLVGPTTRIRRVSHGFRFDFGAVAFTVGDDGRDYPTVPTRTTSIKALGALTWLRVHKVRGQVVDRSTLTVSDDGRELRIHVIKAPGRRNAPADELLLRSGTGLGLAGVWRSTVVGATIPKRFTVERRQSDELRWTYPDDGQYYDVVVDGRSSQLRGARSVPGVTLRLRSMGPLQMRSIESVNGKPYTLAVVWLSRDGAMLTETTWQSDAPAIRQHAVYRRLRARRIAGANFTFSRRVDARYELSQIIGVGMRRFPGGEMSTT